MRKVLTSRANPVAYMIGLWLRPGNIEAVTNRFSAIILPHIVTRALLSASDSPRARGGLQISSESVKRWPT
ncbi:hypothetical protein [Novosphingobium album (ex Hu et al. 2023)]|uniref:Uncharacterized protein n=1 Tax=Novosphingobium album (ex Hu et al. 2023) TaxID=2930093 RepID=A0ABT0AXF2_9SPHN|nr:hypothetical protein [Novosphingobium album (ex Hu et al. 2023)]MCJ2177315.1 hypothetical protein [Novosphingobium album (ex Hu et al. 2023)]